ncbi:MAG TPA: YceI family protein [Puia sp.]|nr:YceI family protein [Puia sp.]
MNKLFYPLAAILLLAGSAFTYLTTPGWQVATGYSIAFSSDDASGIFRDFRGSLSFDDSDPAAGKFDVAVEVASINTGNAMQNRHAKSDEWFDAVKYPQIHFASKSISRTASGYQVSGELEMHGSKKPVTIPFVFKKTAQGGLFTGSFNLNRNDYGIGKPGGGVGEQVRIDISVPVTKI